MFLTDGFRTLITNAFNPNIVFKEKELQPPGMDKGGELDTTTMRNFVLRTKQPKKLTTLTEIKVVVQYDPIVYTQIINVVPALALIGKNVLWTVFYPDGSSLTLYAWLDKFIPNQNKEGDFVLAETTIIPSNQDNNGNEVFPGFNQIALNGANASGVVPAIGLANPNGIPAYVWPAP